MKVILLQKIVKCPIVAACSLKSCLAVGKKEEAFKKCFCCEERWILHDANAGHLLDIVHAKTLSHNSVMFVFLNEKHPWGENMI